MEPYPLPVDPGICPGRIWLGMVPCRRYTLGRSLMPSAFIPKSENYIDQLDPRASEGLRNSVEYLLHDYIVSSAGELLVATINLAIQNGVCIASDEIRAILNKGDKSNDKSAN